ncbi:P-loop containing nucleoside triphosphate hydrolase protein [Bisporella sp. PMI_857]|nr:P-loop containing nucleoside triphosphate hydrolase protein [Bisporella sp. PMI_857]
MASAISFGDGNIGFQAGIISGSVGPVNIHHHTPPETPPNPSIVIPFSRDTDFVHRGILDQIHQKCAVLGSRTALVGLGGVGKSQLAIEYAYQIKGRSPKMWVFWAHTSNAARFEQSFRDIADRVKIFGRQNPTASIFQLVHDWLCDDRKEWVLILDNVDDAGFLVEDQSAGQDGQTNGIRSGNSRPLVEYIPQCLNGSILITTRSESAALKLVDKRNIITVEPMGRADALALFENKLGKHDNSGDTSELVAALEFMPLAIAQAARYISQRVPRYSVRRYLEDFRKSDYKKSSLLNYQSEQLRRDREAKNSIIITWQISFDHIREIRPSAADLLSLMSFFDRQGIPETLLRNRSERRNSWQDQEKNEHNSFLNNDANYSDDNEDKTSQSSVSDGFEDDILALRNYSFIFVNMDGTTFEMHGLVQLATREWLKAHKQQEKWKQQFVKSLYAEFPTGEYENWAKCQMLFPHAQSAVAQQPDERDSLTDWASILYKAAWYAWRIGKGVEAEKMAVQVMKVRKKIFGHKHDDTLDSMVMVGLAYKLNGLWDAAEMLFVQVIETRKKKLGADHPNTLTSMANLASTYRHQGRWDAAEKLFVQVMETRKKKLGADHPDTLTSMANLASTYRNQGRWDAAEKLEVQVIETSKKKLGADHPDTLTSMNNLAFTWKGTGREIEAVKLMEECVQSRKRVLGLNHPHTISSCTALYTWKAEQEGAILSVQSTKDG